MSLVKNSFKSFLCIAFLLLGTVDLAWADSYADIVIEIANRTKSVCLLTEKTSTYRVEMKSSGVIAIEPQQTAQLSLFHRTPLFRKRPSSLHINLKYDCGGKQIEFQTGHYGLRSLKEDLQAVYGNVLYHDPGIDAQIAGGDKVLGRKCDAGSIGCYYYTLYNTLKWVISDESSQ